jgi:hypothetical protein
LPANVQANGNPAVGFWIRGLLLADSSGHHNVGCVAADRSYNQSIAFAKTLLFALKVAVSILVRGNIKNSRQKYVISYSENRVFTSQAYDVCADNLDGEGLCLFADFWSVLK